MLHQYAELHSNKVDICFVSETWLNKNVPLQMVCPDGYTRLRKHRSDLSAGGGVAII